MAKFKDVGKWLQDKVGQRVVTANQRVSDFSYDFVASAIKQTPVDTSLALSNWRVSVGYDVTGTVQAYAQGSKGSTASLSRGSAMAIANAKLSTRQLEETIYIVNKVEYIGYLNKGTSPQASRGYVTRLIQKLGNDLRVGL